MTWTTRPRFRLGDLAAIVQGRGPVVLLLHGVGLKAEAWAPLIDVLSASHRVVAPDMPGHGHSAFRAGLNSVADYADALMPWLGEPACVAGHSMGALIALELAARAPGKVRCVAALNAIFERSIQAQQAVSARAAALDGTRAADPEPTLARWFTDRNTPECTACGNWLNSVDPQGYRTAYKVFADDAGPSRVALAKLLMPALFLTGSREPNSTPAMSRAMAALAPHGQAQIIDGAAHMMPMTHHKEVAAHLVPFATGPNP